MTDPAPQRRLAAILAADVVGYTSAMASDEAGTLAEVQHLLREVVQPAVAGQEGRIFKRMGDGILTEFPSSVGAAQCAAAIQTAMASAESSLQLRIGLHVGDVIVEGDDLFGDGVNVAARLESQAEPGAVVASEAFRNHAEGRAGLAFDDLGDRILKNVPEPMRIFALRRDGVEPVAPRRRKRVRMTVIAGVVAVLVVLTALWVMPEFLRGTAPPGEEGPPSVAVLPFDNLSQDVEQAYFADGLAEDLITDLSKIQGIRVVSRTSSFAFRQGGTPVGEIARRLNARYVVEGSVRRSGGTLRITASLIDATTDTPVWSDRFDGAGEDVFSFQDEITDDIIAALRVKLTPEEQRAVGARGTENPAAYDAYLRGLRLLSEQRRLDVEANAAAQAAFLQAIQLDRNYALAYAGLAWAKWLYVVSINVFNWEADTEAAFQLAEKSLSIADNALARRTLAKRHFMLMSEWVGTSKNIDAAVADLEAAYRLQPNEPDVIADLASVLPFAGRAQEALGLIDRAREMNPNHPDWYFAASGIAALLTSDVERAIRDLLRWRDQAPHFPTPYMFLASAYGLAGELEKGKAAYERHSYLNNGSFMTLYAVNRTWPMQPAEQTVFLRGLKTIGVRDIPG